MSHWWVDGHLDLGYLAARGRDLTKRCTTPGECISIPDLLDGEVRLAFATIYLDPDAPGTAGGYGGSDDCDGAEHAAELQLGIYQSLEQQGHVNVLRSQNDLDNLRDCLNIVLLMEGADPIRTPAHASKWFEQGVRLVGLTWATGTRYAGGNARPGPISAQGRELIAALDELGMVHDISHLADEAARELFALSTGRVVATHSNARAVVADVQRHIPDNLIKAVDSRGGIIGLNLYSKFLTPDRRAQCADAIRSVEHTAAVMGHRRGVALGSDADGGFLSDQLPEQLDHPTRWRQLQRALAEEGWSDPEVKAFAHGNWMEFLRSALPG